VYRLAVAAPPVELQWRIAGPMIHCARGTPAAVIRVETNTAAPPVRVGSLRRAPQGRSDSVTVSAADAERKAGQQVLIGAEVHFGGEFVADSCVTRQFG